MRLDLARADDGDRTRDPQLGKPSRGASVREWARLNRRVMRFVSGRHEPPRVGVSGVRWHGRWHGAERAGAPGPLLPLALPQLLEPRGHMSGTRGPHDDLLPLSRASLGELVEDLLDRPGEVLVVLGA
jgi:hypothetical protein